MEEARFGGPPPEAVCQRRDNAVSRRPRLGLLFDTPEQTPVPDPVPSFVADTAERTNKSETTRSSQPAPPPRPHSGR